MFLSRMATLCFRREALYEPLGKSENLKEAKDSRRHESDQEMFSQQQLKDFLRLLAYLNGLLQQTIYFVHLFPILEIDHFLQRYFCCHAFEPNYYVNTKRGFKDCQSSFGVGNVMCNVCSLVVRHLFHERPKPEIESRIF